MEKINISINLTFKNIIKVLAITALIFTILISILYFQEYEISELTPSIISSDLQENSKENIFNYKTTIFLEKSKLNSNFNGCNCNGTLYLTPDFAIISAIEILNNKKGVISCCQYEIINMSETKTPFIQITDSNLNIFYSITYNEKNIPYLLSINNVLFNDDFSRKPENYTLKNYLDVILDTHEFTLITKDNDSIFLVKDLGDNFLIYDIWGGITRPSFIKVSLYEKKKYFNKIFK